jgi:Rrf2 family protein
VELVLNRRTHLALSAFEVLSQANQRMSRAALAEAVGTSNHFLPQVLRPLIDAGWVASQRGPTGGYELIVDPATVSLLDVVEVVEGPMAGRCVLTGGACPGDQSCPFHATWTEVQASLRTELGRRSMHE